MLHHYLDLPNEIATRTHIICIIKTCNHANGYTLFFFFWGGLGVGGGAKGQRKPEDRKACKLDYCHQNTHYLHYPLHDSHTCTGKCDLISSLEHVVLDDGTSISLDAEDPYHTNYSQPSRNGSSDPKGQELHE